MRKTVKEITSTTFCAVYMRGTRCVRWEIPEKAFERFIPFYHTSRRLFTESILLDGCQPCQNYFQSANFDFISSLPRASLATLILPAT